MKDSSLYVFGTYQNGEAVEGIIEMFQEINPDQLFLEMLNSDIREMEISHYCPDWLTALSLGLEYNKDVYGIDHIVRTKIPTNVANNRALELMISFGKRDFRELNKRKYDVLWSELGRFVFEPDQLKRRQSKMVEKVNKYRDKTKSGLVLVGLGHLKYFEKNLPEATFLYRE